jgi:cell division protein FtsW
LIKPYRLGRIITFARSILEGSNDLQIEVAAKAWQAKQSLIAVGTGGWTGLGPGMGIQKHYFLPAVYTDYVFANICEELGFIGAVALLLLFATLCFIGFRVAYKSPDFVGALLVTGLTAMVAVPALINVAVVLGCAPTKGLALPFISYGGSSLLVNLSAMGLLMNIARRNEEIQEVKRPVAVTPERRLWKWGRTENVC